MEKRLEVRLVNNHPAASVREVAHFRNIRRSKAIRCLAAAQIALQGETSMWRCEVRHEGRWVEFGSKSNRAVRNEVQRLATLWNPLDDLRPRPVA